MSRELLGLVLIGVLCIMVSPLFKETREIEKPKPVEIHEMQILKRGDTIKAENSKNIVFMSDSFLPKTFAGSELSAYETLKYMKRRGHNINIFIKDFTVNEYDGFPIHKFDSHDRYCITTIQNADIVFMQMSNKSEYFNLVQSRNKPTFIFIHVINSYDWLLQHKVKFPITIVYNSHMTQDRVPTFHDNMRMVPYVDTDKFKELRKYTVQNDVVCLINCSSNKGGNLFKTLAYKLSNIQFLGVKGGYGDQIIDESLPSNLKYIENQKDIREVFKVVGILIMPSKNETWGRTAVEAMASGVPVIHSDSAGLVECVGGAGILCMRDDEDAWAEAIRRIVGDRAYRERLRQNGFKRVREIEIEQIRGRQELALKVEKV